MRKVNLTADEQVTNDYIDKIAAHPLLAEYQVTIQNVNDFALYLDELEHCKHCRGLEECQNSNVGYLLTPEEDRFVLSSCKYKKEALKLAQEGSLIKTLFVPKNILNANLEQFDLTTENRRKINQYILEFIGSQKNHQFMKGLYLYGDFSTGKTFVLGAVANELAKNQTKSLLIYFPDLIVEMKNAIGTPRFEELMNYLKSVDVLFLDDLGSENMTAWVRDEVLGPVLNYRLMEEKPIFISSNIDPTRDDLLRHFSITNSSADQLKGQRIISRLTGLVKMIEMDNKSYLR